MTNTTKVAITGSIIAAAIGVSLWKFGGLARAIKSAKPDSHRAQGASCPETRPPGTPNPEGGACKTDADCAAGKNGRCSSWSAGRMAPQNICTYDTCFSDKDCGTGLCTCDGHGNYCLGGNCRVDSDCGTNGFCSPSWSLCSLHGPYRPNGYYCHSAKDECMKDSDCPKPKKQGYGPQATRCIYSAPVGRWTCMSETCPVG
jgi:hypothetical protein